MDKNILGTNAITQIGIVVNNIEKTSEAYARFLGMDKPKTNRTETVDQTKMEFRGEVSHAQAKLASFHLGALQLDLIEPDEHPSAWREFLDEHGEGVLHIAFIVDGMQEKISLLERINIPLVQKAEFKGGRYAYMDSLKDLKVLLEVMEFDQ
ncbi:VOC family protein [Halalkalibacter kiskunsagensis]|uniref:VOC family protein n=1 Tax=Halalkalibacter kiskunsagensis TaxID=1548599 RepID=A0ABV6KEE0_9BACI